MFVILTYDIQVKRVNKVRKICAQYLNHVQNSVFEGNLGEAALSELMERLQQLVKTAEDTVCIYRLNSFRYAERSVIGCAEQFDSII